MSDEVQLSMSLPLDGDGFLRRECPTCEREFKWLPSPDQLEEGNGESRAAATDAEPPEAYYCPYCATRRRSSRDRRAAPRRERARAYALSDDRAPQLVSLAASGRS